MKQTLIAAMLAAILSSMLTVLVERALRSPPPSVASTQGPLTVSAPDIERSLESIGQDLAAIAATTAAIQLPSAASGHQAPQGSGSHPTRTAEAPSVPTSWGTASRTIAPADLLARFREIGRVDPDRGALVVSPEGRAQWILRGEDEVLAGFGRPARIEVAPSGTETWIYRVPVDDGSPDTIPYKILFNRGRVVDIE